ncbi:RNA polymerase sigma factor [Granulicella arctica]|uniref:RNA polymerase sigma-70 factor (ECF subfamily) n=1 Tax=Granulicella arctica TaxID=940613 RepID=A0A7Y9PH09_9BACT|nr:RNA polymerase sigma factor [Granulicella arctica]NYF79604.1 RNA polymerase sigma-70 factor (ECF subfamily) [Granulicella arctica]
MFQQTLQPGELTQGDEQYVSPFDDIATVHSLYEARIFRFLLLSVRNRDIALSLTQDTFLNAWRSRDSFRGECSIATWLTRIAVNLLRDQTRTNTFRFWKRANATAIDVDSLSSHLPHPVRSAESTLIAREKLAQIWKTVEKLSPQQRSIFLLRFVDELELLEIAQAMSMALPTVKSHLYRALDRVRASHTASAGKRDRG